MEVVAVTVVARLRSVSVERGSTRVVRDLDLQLRSGEVVALAGADGSGRTSTLLTLAGFLRPVAGEFDLFGAPASSRRSVAAQVRSRVRRGVSLVPDDRSLFAGLTVAEHLRLGRLRNRPSVDAARVMAWFPDLAPLTDRRAGLLSGGEQQQLALARALVGAPRLLLVDDLGRGLAPLTARSVSAVLRSAADELEVSVLVADQDLGPVLDIADRACLLVEGTCRFDGTPDDLHGARR
jgi:branched-chain amino acid transport system ATP-binding protein